MSKALELAKKLNDGESSGLWYQSFAAADELRRQHAEIDALEDVLQFVERWAVHHGTKPHLTPQEALSCIQHHPGIKAITKSYTDGVVPSTFDPFAEIEALKKDIDHKDAYCEQLGRELSKATAEIEALRVDIGAMAAKLTTERLHSEKLQREIEALRKDAEWQPIETAPPSPKQPERKHE